MARLARMVAGFLIWLALVAQIGAPGLASIAMAGPIDPLANAVICTADGHPVENRQDGPAPQHPCCDTLCQIALVGGALLTPAGVELPPADLQLLTIVLTPDLHTPERWAFYRPNARAPPVASLIAA